MKEQLVLFHPRAEEQARAFASENNIPIGEIPWKYFPDDWPELILDDKAIRDKDVIFFASFGAIYLNFEQFAVIFALPRYMVNSLTVKIVKLPEESFHGLGMWGSVDFRQTILYMLSLTPNTQTGPVTFEFEGSDPVGPIRKEFAPVAEYEDRDLLDFPPDSKKRNAVIFSAHSQREVAEDLAKTLGAEIGNIYCEEGEEETRRELNVNYHELYNQDVIFLASFDHSGECFEQLACIYRLAKQRISNLRVILPFFPVGTMERVDKDGQIATAMTMARLISAIPMIHGKKPAIVDIYDIHALATQFFFGDTVLINFKTAIPLIKERIKNIPNVSIVFPDDGARKRFGKKFDEYLQIVCDKIRDGEKRIITIKEGNPKGRHCIIVDDIGLSCTTLEECCNALKKAGAKTVSAAIIHGVFPGGSEKRLSKKFRHAFFTDSCPVSTRYRAALKLKNAELLELKPLLIEALKK